MLSKLFKKNPNDNYNKKLKAFFEEFNQFNWEDKNSVKSIVQEVVLIIEPRSSAIKTGNSKLGGTPDLPLSIKWPTYENKSMSFFGQINLSEISEFHRNEYLPKTGMLYFFSYFPAPESEYGAEYNFLKNKEEYSVIYFNGVVSELKQTPFPTDLCTDYKFTAQKMAFETAFQMPVTLETGIIENNSLSENDKMLIEDFNETQQGTFERILGYPIPAQYGVDYDWALSYLNINPENGESDQEISEIRQIQPEFVNLLSIPLFESIGWANAYFGILKRDLINRDFEKAVFVMQDS